MTASPSTVNGHARPAMPVLGDWQPIEATPTETETVPEPATDVQPDNDLVAQAKAEAIRAQAWADAEAKRIEAEGEAQAKLATAEEEARKLRLANDRVERRAREEEAASNARIAESNRKRDEADRARKEATERAAEQVKTEKAEAEKVEAAEDSWRFFAIAFAVVCGVVALPVQMAAFWTEKAPWMISAPFMLEGAAWVVLRGAAAAVASHRPHWHFRLIAWLLAFVAAGVNLWHGLLAFDPATAIGTAVASIAGPGVWDLHEHGRIRKRDGVPTRRERKAAEKEAERIASERAAEEKRRAAEKAAADEAAAEKAKALTERRKALFPKVWEYAEKLATDLGETDPNAVWERAKLDIEGAPPGESAEVLRMRNAAEIRVEAARQNKPVNTLSKTTNAQRASHLSPEKKTRVYNPPARAGRRTKGDSPRFSDVARRQASIAAKTDRPNAN